MLEELSRQQQDPELAAVAQEAVEMIRGTD
jgi:hypothetical protein